MKRNNKNTFQIESCSECGEERKRIGKSWLACPCQWKKSMKAWDEFFDDASNRTTRTVQEYEENKPDPANAMDEAIIRELRTVDGGDTQDEAGGRD